MRLEIILCSCVFFCLVDVLNKKHGLFMYDKTEMILWKFIYIMLYFLGSAKYNSYLWSLERDNKPPVYLFGTVHAPYDLVWRYIPTNAKDALFDATDVYTEVNLKDQKVINEIRQCRQLPGNKTLKDVLQKDLFDELLKGIRNFESRKRKWIRKFSQSLFKDYNIPGSDTYNQYARLKPAWLISTILQQWNKFAVRLMFKPRMSLDSYIVKEADQMGIYNGGIEDVSMHCDPMDNLGEERVNLALNVTLRAQNRRMSGRLKLKENDIRTVANLYKCGDPLNASKLGTLFSNFVDDNMKERLEEIDEYLTRELVYKRNILMAKKIDQMLKDRNFDDAKLFYAVGAAHLLGNDSVVTLLQQKGYRVRHIKPNEEIPATIEKRKLLEEGRNIFAETMNSSIWRKVQRPDLPNKPPIIIIKRVEKKYVYYYNTGKRVVSHHLMTMMATMLSTMVWFLR